MVKRAKAKPKPKPIFKVTIIKISVTGWTLGTGIILKILSATHMAVKMANNANFLVELRTIANFKS